MRAQPSLLSEFVLLLSTIGPVETSALFASVTRDVHRADRLNLAWRSVLIAGMMLLIFAVGGGPALSWLHVSTAAFRVAGGVMLFLQALTLSFASHGLSSLSQGEMREARQPGDIAVFPLAFPVIAGPGTLVAVVLLMGRAADAAERAEVLAMLLVCLAVTYAALQLSDVMAGLLGQTGTDVVGRVSGVLLAALAVQFVFDGIREALGGFP